MNTQTNLTTIENFLGMYRGMFKDGILKPRFEYHLPCGDIYRGASRVEVKPVIESGILKEVVYAVHLLEKETSS